MTTEMTGNIERGFVREPVITPDDLTVADLCLAADGLLGDHLAGDAVQRGSRPGHQARVRLDAAVAAVAVQAGGLLIADSETVPVVRLRAPTPSDGPGHAADTSTEPRTLVLSGTAEAVTAATGVGQQARPSRSPVPAPAGTRTVLVLERPVLPGDLADLRGDVVLVVPIAGPSPDGFPAAALLRLARQAEAELTERGVQAHTVAATIAWRRDPESNDAMIAAVGEALRGVAVPLLSARREQSGPWARTLRVVEKGHDPDLPGDLLTELRRWRPPRSRRGLVVFFTGFSGAGKSTIARGLADHLDETGQRTVTLLDGDQVRRLLSAGLGFGAEGRHQNATRIGYVAAEVARHGGVAVCAPIAPYERSRAAAREAVEHAGGGFVLVHVATSLADCEARDVKGLYARARTGEIAEFTGISDPYEVPTSPDVRIETAGRPVADCVAEVVDHLTAAGWLQPADAVRTDAGRTDA